MMSFPSHIYSETKGMRGDVLAVVGAQYGSEGKGVVVNAIADNYDVHVRVGGPNAGHSFYHKDVLYKMQVIPCGWTNPNATLVLGRGMLVDGRHLVHELETLEKVDPSILMRLKVDAFATVLDDRHRAVEGGVDGEIHKRIGSTGEGVGAARVARVNRDTQATSLFGTVANDYVASHGRWTLADFLIKDTPGYLRGMIDRGVNVLLEGTQGSALSLIHGPWPYVTSADTNAGQFSADTGIPPRFINRTMLVARTFPIRVAGNSGPLNDEQTWEQMSVRMGRAIEERTTVTRKVRRIGLWDDQLFLNAVALNAPTSIALMFADYIDPTIEGESDWKGLHSSQPVKAFINHVESLAEGVPVGFVGTGGPRWSVALRGDRP